MRHFRLYLVFGFALAILSGISLPSSARSKAHKAKYSEGKTESSTQLYATVSLRGDKNHARYPEIKADESYNQAQTPIGVRASQNLCCLFEISKTEIQFDETPPQVDVALNPFYATLFDSIISPNAP